MKLRAILPYLPALLLLAATLVYAGAPTTEEVIKAHTTIGTTIDTVIASAALPVPPKDSVMTWIPWIRGTGNVAIKIVTFYRGTPGDSVTIDSFAVTASATERLINTISGDSIRDMAWRNWTSYSATAREYLKTQSSNFTYKMCFVVYTAGSATGLTFGLDRFFYQQ